MTSFAVHGLDSVRDVVKVKLLPLRTPFSSLLKEVIKN
jgi:hypothetical protein